MWEKTLISGMVVALVGCAGEAIVCDPGDTQYCWCEADQQGMQTCDEEGTGWYLCECDAPEDDDVGDDDDDDVVDSGARLEVSPPGLVFDQVEIGCEATDDVTLISVGQQPLEIWEVGLQTASSEITVILHEQLPIVLAPGDSTDFTVQYAPVDEVGDHAWVVIDNNDPTNAEATIAVETWFAANQRVEDEFEQVATPAVDVLWVLDNSSSMGEEQDFLKSAIPTFVEVAFPPDHLGYLGVVTTDGNQLLGNPNVLITDMPDVIEAFMERVAVGTGGSDTSQGLAMGSQAITPPLAAPGGANYGFPREEAGLVVIFVSDEEDESPDTVTAYVNPIQSLKVDPDKVRLVAVTGGAAGCQSGVAGAEPEEPVHQRGRPLQRPPRLHL